MELYVCDGRRAAMVPAGRGAFGSEDTVRVDVTPGDGEQLLLMLVQGGFGAFILFGEDPSGLTASNLEITEARLIDGDVIEYALRIRATCQRQRVRFDRATYAIVERDIEGNGGRVKEKWKTTFDTALPDWLFVVPERRK